MATLGELLKQGRYEELWQRCCGFIDLSIEDFMNIQKRLLLEQLELLKKCELGRYIMNGADPHTVEEFREQVPLTTYADYAPYLLKRRRNVLPGKPLMWAHTSGRSGEYFYKWIPITARQYEEAGPIVAALLLFCTCKQRGDVVLRQHNKMLYAAAPAPYLSGVMGRMLDDESIVDFLPPVDKAEKMEFADRLQEGFKLALLEGMEIFGGISSVMVAIGERFSQGNANIDIKRLLKGVAKSKLAHRPILPQDVWSLKGIIGCGTDTPVFEDRIKEMWGRYPLEVYGCTEASVVATQTWDYQGMTFVPHLNFLEFIPEKESLRSKEDRSYQPKTLLLDEVKAGERYEIVITNFYGGALIRYRIGDMIRITSLRNEQLNIDIPQMEFYSRVDDLIDIAGFTRLTEGIIWRAIERSGVDYADWTVRKEVANSKPTLRLYIETKTDSYRPDDITSRVHEQLKKLDGDYANIESFLGLKPLGVTLLPKDAFQAYMLQQQAAGADLAHLKIPHINPSDGMLDFLINGSCRVVVTSS